MRALPAHLRPDCALGGGRGDALGGKVWHTLEDGRPVRQHLAAAAKATVGVQRLLASIAGCEECPDCSRIVSVHRHDQLLDDVGHDSTPFSWPDVDTRLAIRRPEPSRDTMMCPP